MEKVDLVVATTNKGKLVEIQEVLKGLPLNLLTLKDIHFSEKIVEDKDTFKENAILKAMVVAQHTGKLTLADDSGLEVDALQGRPGVYSARFAGEEASDRENNLKLLEMMKLVPEENRKANFRCVIALASAEKLIGTVEGTCEGSIGFKEEGEHGFGYDPLFVLPEHQKTFAQLGAEVKNKVSHRAKALEKLNFLLETALTRLT